LPVQTLHPHPTAFFFLLIPRPPSSTLFSLHDALPIFLEPACDFQRVRAMPFHPQRQCFQSAERQETVEGSRDCADRILQERDLRSEEHTSELQSLAYLVCRLLLEKKKGINDCITTHIR